MALHRPNPPRQAKPIEFQKKQETMVFVKERFIHLVERNALSLGRPEIDGKRFFNHEETRNTWQH